VTTKRTRITSVVSQSGTLIRQSVNVQITFDDTPHTHVRSLIRMYMTERQHSLIKRTFILGIDMHVHDRKRTFSHETLFFSYHLEIFIKNFQQWCSKLVIRTTGI